MQNIRLDIVRDRKVPYQHFIKLAKSIRVLKNLESFHRNFVLESRRPHLSRELKAYSQSTLRLKKLKKFVFQLSDAEQAQFQKTMRKNRKYPGITGLKINLQGDSFPSYYERFEPMTRREESTEKDEPSEFDNMNPLQDKFFRMLLREVIEKDDGEAENPRNRVNRGGPFGFFGRDDSDEEDEDEEDEEDEDEEDEQEEEERKSNGDDSDEDDREELTDEERRMIGEQFTDMLSGNFSGWQMREAIKSFYRFELFPNLKRVSIRQDDQHIPYDSFVIDAFAGLKNLEDLEITLHSRPKGSYNLFKGLLVLPLIKKLSIGISFVKKDDWNCLQQFMKKQKNLESFSLIIWDQASSKDRYLEQNLYFEDLIKCLENTPSLKSLELKSEFWSLEALSKGLSHLTRVNCLKSFIFEGSDDTMNSDAKSWERVKGLCNFIKNQKASLEKLGVFLPLANEDSVVTYIAEAMTELIKLKELQFSINSRQGHKTFGQYSEGIFELPRKPKPAPRISEPWNPSVAEHFRKLENLEELWFRFDILEKNPPTWVVDIVTALPSLEKLRDIRIMTDSGSKLSVEEKKIANAFEQLKNVRKIDLSYCKFPDEVKQIAKKVNRRQAMRCDLMF